MITITLDRDSRLAVKLTMDMKAYCEAAKRLYDSCKALEELHASREAGADAAAHERVAQLTAAEAKEHFKRIREPYIESLRGLQGELHWCEIKRLLSEQCNRDDPIENRLFSSLSSVICDAGTAPLALESLDNSFIELLKNSIDAIVLNYLKAEAMRTANTTLEMRVALRLVGETLSIVITDNAGGFPAAYLASFDTNVRSRRYDKTSSREKRQYNDYCFGGAGRGLPILCDCVVHGGFSRGDEQFEKIHQVNERETAVAIRNTPDVKGAEITITTPVAPFAAAVSAPRRVVSAGVAPHEGGAVEGVDEAFELSLPPFRPPLLSFPSRARRAPPIVLEAAVKERAEEALAPSTGALKSDPPGLVVSGAAAEGAVAEDGGGEKPDRQLGGDRKRPRGDSAALGWTVMALQLFAPPGDKAKRARKARHPYSEGIAGLGNRRG
ncbi:ATP-binding protein [Legionella nagasakiensis]|uniref:ATP-binding protein n=1 Tax=Legionella nagasakiensis TaxID=535290 RepID=UPI001055AE83|nr:ATP-binding protein [Legionella nagasakiensis]